LRHPGKPGEDISRARPFDLGNDRGPRVPPVLVVLFDVDNTLLDNDAVELELREHVDRLAGSASAERYWTIFEELRAELGYADYLGALQRYRLEDLSDPKLLQLSEFLLEYPFAERLYPGALDAVARAAEVGTTVVLTDGDAVFQPRKIHRSGLWDAFGGRVLVYVHKEQMLGDVERWHPADHYVLVDDKLRILEAVKRQWQDKVTTVFVEQGKYAEDPEVRATYPPADVNLASIAEMASLALSPR